VRSIGVQPECNADRTLDPFGEYRETIERR
jgi:hypothetical protein